MDVVFLIIILFIRETGRERGRKLCIERSSLPTRSPVWDSIPDSRITHELKAEAQPLSHPGIPDPVF